MNSNSQPKHDSGTTCVSAFELATFAIRIHETNKRLSKEECIEEASSWLHAARKYLSPKKTVTCAEFIDQKLEHHSLDSLYDYIRKNEFILKAWLCFINNAKGKNKPKMRYNTAIGLINTIENTASVQQPNNSQFMACVNTVLKHCHDGINYKKGSPQESDWEEFFKYLFNYLKNKFKNQGHRKKLKAQVTKTMTTIKNKQ